jgi:hypothetical protein
VDRQALLVRSALRRLDLDTYIAAPGVEFFQTWYEKGVDDFLGTWSVPTVQLEVVDSPAFMDYLRRKYPDGLGEDEDPEVETWHGKWLDDLVIRGKEVPEAVLDWLGLLRIDRQRRAWWALEGLSLHAGRAGRHDRDLHSLASIMGIGPGRVAERVIDTLEDLKAGGAINVHGSLKTNTTNWNGVKVTDFAERPTIEIAEQFRAVEHEMLVADVRQRRAVEEI